MIVVTGHLKMTPDQLAGLRPAIRAVVEATRGEDGCILYAFAEDSVEPGVVRIVERWRDWPALDAHGKTAHLDAWRQAVRAIGPLIDREVTAHETGASRAL